MLVLRLFVAAALIVSCLTTAHAEDVAAAKVHYERGTTLFDLQRYLEAAKEYEAAFEAKNDPALLFNIAQAYRFGGDYTKAIAAYRSFLRRVPNADNRDEIERRIVELQKLSDEQKRNQQTPPTGTLIPGEQKPATESPGVAAAPAPAPTPTASVQSALPPHKPNKTKLIAGIIVAGAGIVAIAAGAAFEGIAASTDNSLSHPAMGTTFDPGKERSLKTDETAGAILLALGGAALVAGGVIAILGVRERAKTVAVVPVVTSHDFGVVMNASF